MLTKKFLTIYLFLFCTQIIPLEGTGISNIKVSAMALAFLLLIVFGPIISVASLWSFLFAGVCLFNSIVITGNYRGSTLIYLIMFLATFSMYYGLIYKGLITANEFVSLIRNLLYAYTFFLFLQQVVIFFGIKEFPYINLSQFIARNIGANSLALEPSHSARIMTVAFYAFLKVSEIIQGYPLTLRQLTSENKLLTFGFFYSMVTMGSATAFISIFFLGIYFLKQKNILFIISIGIFFLILSPLTDFNSLSRSVKAVEMTIKGDRLQLRETDDSAAARILPLLNTINNINLTSKDFWVGQGSDTSLKMGVLSEERMIGCINDYGAIAFIIGVILIYKCCLPKVFCLETSLVLVLLGFSLPNIAYVFGIYMILAHIKYFHKQFLSTPVDKIPISPD